MIESIIEWSIRNRMLVILAAIAIAVAGARAMLTTPVDAIPDLSENQVIVFTDWTGRSPQEVEDQITYPLEITRRIKDKITTLPAGLPAGVRIVPFYDRTPLIHQAIETVSGTVKDEFIVCTIAILLVMGHVGNAFVVALTLPLAILFSFLMMQLFGVSSNIMSLAGISISVGILIHQAVVMGENAAYHLSGHFGREPVKGDTTEIIIRACRSVGRPIFFSVLITIFSFLPVFALSGREGKMFHPLAFTKTFALVGVALLSITLVRRSSRSF